MESLDRVQMINQIYPDLVCLWMRYCITETLLPHHFM